MKKQRTIFHPELGKLVIRPRPWWRRLLRALGLGVVLLAVRAEAAQTVVAGGPIQTVTALQGGTWSLTTSPSDSAQNVVSTYTTITATGAAAASFLPVKLVNSGGAFYDASGSAASGPTTVTPGTGTFSVALSTNGSFSAPFYTLSSNTSVVFLTSQTVNAVFVTSQTVNATQLGQWMFTVLGTTFTASNPGIVAGTVTITNIPNQTLVVQSSATTLVASTVAVVNPLGMTLTTQSTWTVVQGTVGVVNPPNLTLVTQSTATGVTNAGGSTLLTISSYTVAISSKIVTFIYVSTVSVADGTPITPSTGTSVLTIMNGASSTHVLKIRRISATAHMGKTVGNGASVPTGVVQLGVIPISAITLAGGTSQIVSRKMDTNSPALDAQVTISTGGVHTFTSDTPLWSSLIVLTTTTVINDRPDIIFEEADNGGQPLVLRPGEGFIVNRSSQPRISMRGEVRTSVLFTME